MNRQPAARNPREFLEHMRAGRVLARGKQGSAAKWAHAAIALAARSLGPAEGAGPTARPDPHDGCRPGWLFRSSTGPLHGCDERRARGLVAILRNV